MDAEIAVKLTAKDQLSDTVKKAGKTVEDTGSKIQQIGKLLTAAFSTQAMVGAAHQAIAYGSAINDAAARTGIATDTYQKLKFAADQNSVSMGVVEGAVALVSRKLTDGDKGLVSALGAMGLQLDDLRGMKPDEWMTVLGDKIASIQDPTLKAGLAVELFGRSGTQMLPMLGQAMHDAKLTVDELSLALSDRAITAADDAGDAADRSAQRWQVLKSSALTPVLESYSALPSSIQTVMAASGELGAIMPQLGTAMIAGGVNPVKAFNGALQLLKGHPIILGLSLAVAAVTAAFVYWDDIKRIVSGVYEAFREFIGDKATAVLDKFIGALKWVYDVHASIIGTVMDTVTDTLGFGTRETRAHIAMLEAEEKAALDRMNSRAREQTALMEAEEGKRLEARIRARKAADEAAEAAKKEAERITKETAEREKSNLTWAASVEHANMYVGVMGSVASSIAPVIDAELNHNAALKQGAEWIAQREAAERLAHETREQIHTLRAQNDEARLQAEINAATRSGAKHAEVAEMTRRLDTMKTNHAIAEARRRFETMTASLDLETEAGKAAYQQLTDAYNLHISNIQLARDQNEGQDKLTKSQQIARFSDTANQMGAIAQNLGIKNKAISTSLAVINTLEGATKALAQGGFAGIILMASVLSAGFAQVKQIQSQKLAKGGILSPIDWSPAGTDIVPAMLSPGEGIVSRSGMARLGTSGLNAINRGDDGALVTELRDLGARFDHMGQTLERVMRSLPDAMKTSVQDGVLLAR